MAWLELSTFSWLAAFFLVYLVLRYTPRRGWPLLGNLPYIVKTRDRQFEYQLLASEANEGNYSFTMPFLRIIVLRTPEEVEYVQKTNFNNFVKGRLQGDIMRDVLGKGIFATDGHQWLSQRKTTSYIFSAGSFRGVISRAIDSHLRDLVKVLGKNADAGKEVALNELFFRFTLDTFVSMSFGRELDSILAEQPVPFADAFDYAQWRLDHRFAEPGWKLFERFTAGGKKMKEALRIIDEFAYATIDARDRAGRLEKGEKETAVDLLQLYRSIRDEKGNPMTRKELRDAVLNLIIAGRDTTAQALSWLYFVIISQPDLLEPIRTEIHEVLGDKDVDYDNYQSLVRCKAVFYEAVRLFPSVPKNGKQCLSDDVLPNGTVIKKGEIVSWSDWVMARNPRIWGPDAKIFKPSRWIDESGRFIQRSQWLFHSFNAGPRLCLGSQEAIAVIVAITRNFDFTFARGYLESVPKAEGLVDCGDVIMPLCGNSLTLPMRHAMRINVTRR